MIRHKIKSISIGIVIAGLFLGLIVGNASAWWNTSWSKRTPICINNTGNSNALTDYQVMINITYDSDMNSNFSDIRVVNDTSGETVPYWIENKSDGNWCKIWFNASYIPASSWCNDTYYLYYGNPSASSESDGDAVFEFFDDFEFLDTGNPVMNEDVYEKDPGVWYDSESDTYYIFFTYRPDPSSSSNSYISMRTTSDHFKTYSSRTDLWNHYAAPSNIVKRDSTYYMFFQSYPDSADEKGYCRIFYSTSTDLVNWTTPTLAFERSTGWNGGTKRAIDPNLYKEGDTWYLFYVGDDNGKNAVGYATTSDADFPTGWVDQTTSEPLLTPTESWEGSIIEAITVWKVGDLYYMLYSGGSSPQQEGLATASDISGPWTRYGTDGRVNHPFEPWSQYSLGQYDILRQGAESWRSGEHWNDGKYHVIFQGRDSSTVQSWSLGLATSEDLINYTNLEGKWVNTYTSGVETTNGYLKFVDPEPKNNILKGMYSNAVFDPSSHAIVCRVWGKPKGESSYDDFFGFGWYKDDENNYKVDFGPSNLRDWDLGVGGLVNDTWYGVTGYNDEFVQETYYTLQLRKVGTTVYLDVDYVNKLSKSNDGFTFSDTKVGMNIWVKGEWRIDWILVRKYADPEPTASLGSEEEQTTDTSFTVTLPAGYTYAHFNLTGIEGASTKTNWAPEGQNSTTPFYNITNTGNVNLTVKMKINATIPNVILKADTDNNPAGAKEINTTYAVLCEDLPPNEYLNVWLWTDLSHAAEQETGKNLTINVTQVL